MNNNLTILQPFLNHPHEKLHLAHIAKEVHMPHPTARLHLNKLTVLEKSYQGRNTCYKLKTYHPHLLHYLCIAQKERLIDRNDGMLNEVIECIAKDNSNATIIIFGSFVLDPMSANDLDILIVGKHPMKNLDNLGITFSKEIHAIHVDSFDKIDSVFKNQVIQKHLIIQNVESAQQWMLTK